MKQYIQALMAALIAVVVAQVAMAGDAKDTKNLTAGEQFEYATGWNAEVFGGATPFQNGDFHVTGPGGTFGEHAADRVNGVAGAKVGYVWNPGWTLSAVGAKDVAVLPSLDVEGFWTGYQGGSEFKANGTVGGAYHEYLSDQDIYVLSVDPTLKFQIGRFRPYVGAGVGAAYLTVDGTHNGVGGVTTVYGSANDFALALQGLAGVETFINKNWSIDIGYKYLSLLNPSFGSQTTAAGGTISTSFPAWYGEHIVTAGVKFYF